MDPQAAAPLPPQVGQMFDYGLLIIQFLLCCGIVERAVAVFKHMKKMTWQMPWAGIAFILSWAICAAYHIDLIEQIYKVQPGPVLMFIPGSFFGVLLSAAVLSGGGAGLVSIINTAVERGEKVHAKKLEQMTKQTTVVQTDVSTHAAEVEVKTS